MKSKFGQKFVQTSEFTVKALMSLNDSYRYSLQRKTDMKVKMFFHTKLCALNKVSDSEMQNL